MVKAPFTTLAGGREWMWVEVSAWNANGQISGLLRNEPEDVPGLHGGQTVNVHQRDVFDYLRVRTDGVTEGNETSQIIEAMQQSR